jgi:hypothetical protein
MTLRDKINRSVSKSVANSVFTYIYKYTWGYVSVSTRVNVRNAVSRPIYDFEEITIGNSIEHKLKSYDFKR